MLVRKSSLRLWRGEPVPQTTTAAHVHRLDGTTEEITVAPYRHEVSLPPEVETKWTDEELSAHDLSRFEPFVVPEGKLRKNGRQEFVVGDGGRIFEKYEIEDAPLPPRDLTVPERIQRLMDDYGLTKDDLKEAVKGVEAVKR